MAPLSPRECGPTLYSRVRSNSLLDGGAEGEPALKNELRKVKSAKSSASIIIIIRILDCLWPSKDNYKGSEIFHF